MHDLQYKEITIRLDLQRSGKWVVRTSRFSSASSLPAVESKSLSISSRGTFAVSGTNSVAHKLVPKQATEKIMNVTL